jgi:hypothetical protein
VDYHPAYPYSVFLGPKGAQFNLPQMYWGAIGVSVKEIYRRTYNYGTLYGKPIYPLGQTYGGVKADDIDRFRRYAQLYGATGVSWWSWQASPQYAWRTLKRPLPALPADHQPKPPATPTLSRGARGDYIIWAQQHLADGGYDVSVNGVFDRATSRAVSDFQTVNGLDVTAKLDPPTWSALLGAHDARATRWSAKGKRPATAELPAVRNELRAIR